jgi:tetratricopeptide (TPR) repeat protein
MDLSFCIIVKNEAELLPQCLDSVRPVVDEMIVVDTGSTDRTCEIAASYGARVHEFAWCDDFAAARNASLQYAQGDWILVLDADETLVPAIVPLLLQMINSPEHLLINLVRQEVGAAQSPYSLVSRLFRRHPQVYFTRPYHAMVDDSIDLLLQQEPHWQICSLAPVAIWHTGYQPGVIATQNKAAKARKIMEGYLANHPKEPYVCSKLGALYVQMGELTAGLNLLKRGLQSLQDSAEQNPLMLYEIHYHLGSVYAEQQKLYLAEQHYQAAQRQPILPTLKIGAINNLGSLLKDQGNLAGAQSLFQQALTIDPEFAIAHYNLGLTLKAMGQLGAAIAHYQQAIALQPDYAEAHQNLGVALLKAGHVPDSLTAFRQAIALHTAAGSPEAERLRQGLQEMGFTV